MPAQGRPPLAARPPHGAAESLRPADPRQPGADDARRRARRRRELEPGDATSLWAVDPLQALETRAELLQALGQLHERQRAVLVLRYFNDLTEAQVADVLGCSPGTVKSSASRGLARLREALQPVPLQPRSTET